MINEGSFMADHTCNAIVITCIDFRFQDYINKWISEKFAPKTYDRGAFAGVARSIDIVLTQINVSRRLHNIKKAILINHEDCGAYGPQGHKDHHVEDLQQAKERIQNQFPGVEVYTYYLHLDGTFEEVS